jgi:hypothetical protein
MARNEVGSLWFGSFAGLWPSDWWSLSRGRVRELNFAWRIPVTAYLQPIGLVASYSWEDQLVCRR